MLERKENKYPNYTYITKGGFCHSAKFTKEGYDFITFKKFADRSDQEKCEIKSEDTIGRNTPTLHTYYNEKNGFDQKIVFFSYLLISKTQRDYLVINKINTKEMKIIGQFKVSTAFFPDMKEFNSPISFLFKKTEEGKTHVYVYERNKFQLKLLELEIGIILNRRQVYGYKPESMARIRPELDLIILQEDTGLLKIFSLKNKKLVNLVNFNNLIDSRAHKIITPISKLPVKVLNKHFMVLVAADHNEVHKYRIEG